MLPDLRAFAKANRSAPLIGVYDGQTRLGTIAETGGESFAFDALGNALGSFRKRSDAMRSIPAQVEPKPPEARRG